MNHIQTLCFVPLQAAFDRAAERGGPAHWIGDGVHPTPAGHALIAEQWRATVGWTVGSIN